MRGRAHPPGTAPRGGIRLIVQGRVTRLNAPTDGDPPHGHDRRTGERWFHAIAGGARRPNDHRLHTKITGTCTAPGG